MRNALPGDTFTLTYETNETYTNTGKNARKYTAKVTALGNANYSLSQEESIHPWVINPKAVTVKPDDLHKHIGGEEPQLTYTTDGIVEGETLSGITLQRVSGEDARNMKLQPQKQQVQIRIILSHERKAPLQLRTITGQKTERY